MGPPDPGGYLGRGKWGATESWPQDAAVRGSLKLQDFRVRRQELESDLGSVEGVAAGDLP